MPFVIQSTPLSFFLYTKLKLNPFFILGAEKKAEKKKAKRKHDSDSSSSDDSSSSSDAESQSDSSSDEATKRKRSKKKKKFKKQSKVAKKKDKKKVKKKAKKAETDNRQVLWKQCHCKKKVPFLFCLVLRHLQLFKQWFLIDQFF